MVAAFLLFSAEKKIVVIEGSRFSVEILRYGQNRHSLPSWRKLFRQLRMRRHGQVCRATESNRAASIQARPHQDELRGEVSRTRTPIHIPIRPLGFKKGASPDNAEPGPAVGAFTFRPLPDIAAHIVTAERRSPGRESFHRRR